MHRPVTKNWHLLTTGQPLLYTPTASNTTLRITLKNNHAEILSSPKIYSLTVLSLADIAISTATTHGKGFLRPSGHENSTFATSYPPSNLHFMMTAFDYLPVYAVTDVLRGIQELTHYLYFLELVFDVFSDPSLESLPIASGCLALDCGSRVKTVQSRDLEYVNISATNSSAAPSRRLQSSTEPIQLTILNRLEAVSMTYEELKDPLPIQEQSFADVADRILANITDLIISDESDGLLPLSSTGNNGRLIRSVDTWGSTLGISLLQMNLPGINFTLDQAAMALKATQNNLNKGPMMESRMKIMVEGSLVGWGCLMYTNTSTWRCILPRYY